MIISALVCALLAPPPATVPATQSSTAPTSELYPALSKRLRELSARLRELEVENQELKKENARLKEQIAQLNPASQNQEQKIAKGLAEGYYCVGMTTKQAEVVLKRHGSTIEGVRTRETKDGMLIEWRVQGLRITFRNGIISEIEYRGD